MEHKIFRIGKEDMKPFSNGEQVSLSFNDRAEMIALYNLLDECDEDIVTYMKLRDRLEKLLS